MALGIVQKILNEHIVDGEPEAGSEVGIRVDQTLTQDATGTLAYLQFEALGTDRVRTELSVSYVDHNTAQIGPENADDHAYLQSVAAKYGIVFSQPGNGICHQVHFERFGVPGQTLLGSDSHTPTAGALGMFALGAGGLDVAAAMAGHPFYLTYPKVLNVSLAGKLRDWVSTKDVILRLVGVLSTKGNVGTAIEYSGEGIPTLTAEQRATIANMGAETGVTTSVFPSDKETKRFLAAQGRKDVWKEITADNGAAYDRDMEMDLSTVVPMTARPHSPGNVVPVEETAGLKVDQVIIGSCTNASFRDLSIAADILRGKRVHPGTALIVVPGSRQALAMIMESGALAVLIGAGARVLEPACGFCIGNGCAPASGAVSLRTNNRNFEGRCGTPDAGVYLVSPETAAASAVAGEMTDPRTIGGRPSVSAPSRFPADDAMLIFPPEDSGGVEIKIPPHMGELPAAGTIEDSISAAVAAKVADKTTTDHIIPGGNRLKHRSNIAKYAEFTFEGIDPRFVKRCRANSRSGRGSVIVAGESYGRGSSREHAALCPAYLGVRAVAAKSFERIHAANLANFGIVPLTFVNTEDYDKLNVGDEVEVLGLKDALSSGGNVRLREAGSGREISLACSVSPRQADILLAGGMLNFLREPTNGSE